jgi:FkbM family methyltransferase
VVWTSFARIRLTLDLLIGHRLVCVESFTFIQVGANDGVTDDPLKKWLDHPHVSGMLIEPQSEPFARLEARYMNHHRITTVCAAVGSDSEPRLLYRLASQDAGGSSSVYSSFDRRVVEAASRRFSPRPAIESVSVPCITFGDITAMLHCPPYVDLLLVDTEGFDFEVLKLAFAAGMNPVIIAFEFTHLTRAVRMQALSMLRERGYLLAQSHPDFFAYRADCFHKVPRWS